MIDESGSNGVKVLDLDIENKPLSYWFDGQCTAEVTAIAAGWTHQKKIHCWTLDKDVHKSYVDMLSGFRQMYDEADCVTGHYILRHDLPLLNGAMLEAGLPILSPKLVSDTKVHLRKRKDLSMSQESLADLLGVQSDKYHMTQGDWREANRLTKKGVRLTRKRVISDVRQHKEMRERLIERGMLKAPTMWTP